MNAARASVRILTVCSHNRTRSVMMAALLDRMLASRLDDRAAVLRSAGFGPAGLPAIPDAVDAMAQRGLDISGHRSRPVTTELLEGSDLILTAERDHVVRVAMISRPAFRRAMTMPEFLARAQRDERAGVEAGGGPWSWIEALTEERSTSEYLTEEIGEIDDPTGAPRRVFTAAVDRIEELCEAVAAQLVPRRAI